MNTPSTMERFLNFVDTSGDCWIWVGTTVDHGYGQFSYGEKKVSAHRMSYQLFKEDFDPTFCVCHICDNPSCVRPSHLFLGTQQENIDDMFTKGRESDRKGAAHPNAKLTNAGANTILSLYKEGISYHDLANRFGVSYSVVWKLINGKTWNHLEKEFTNEESLQSEVEECEGHPRKECQEGGDF